MLALILPSNRARQFLFFEVDKGQVEEKHPGNGSAVSRRQRFTGRRGDEFPDKQWFIACGGNQAPEVIEYDFPY